MRCLIACLALAGAAGCSCSDDSSVQSAKDGAAGLGGSAASGGSSTGGVGGSAPDAGNDADADDGSLLDCKHVPVVEDCKEGWCRIPAGCFVMGSPKDEWGRGANDENQVKVTITRSFLIQQVETRQAEWVAMGLNNPSTAPIKPGDQGDCLEPECPVGNVTWFEVALFANLLSEQQGITPCYILQACGGQVGAGMTCSGIGSTAPTYYECEGYRLPGEAEWEYAARAGTNVAFYTGPITTYPGDVLACNKDANLEKAAWYCQNSGTVTHPVGLKSKNGWGLYDMLGNAHEWTNDLMKGLGYGTMPLVDPWGNVKIVDPIEPVVLRGGGPITPASRCRAAAHFSLPRDTRGGGFGFRLVRTLLPPTDAGASIDASLDAMGDSALSDVADSAEE